MTHVSTNCNRYFISAPTAVTVTAIYYRNLFFTVTFFSFKTQCSTYIQYSRQHCTVFVAVLSSVL